MEQQGQEQTNEGNEKSNIPQMIIGAVVLLIIIGGLIALSSITGPSDTDTAQEQENGNDEYNLAAVEYDSSDPSAHIRGAADPEIVIVEYSDFECPFCDRFHPTMQQIMDEYGDVVQWEYRHLPLTSIHPQAMPAAVASECAASLGGNEAFWGFADEMFANQEQLGRALYVQTATSLGLDEAEFSACLDADNQQPVRDDIQEARTAGGTGTPFTVVIGPNGEREPFIGARPYGELESLVTSMLE